jgi:hypothetical protein
MADNLKPVHYMKGTIETIDFIKEVVCDLDGIAGFYVGNILKYISRYKQKNGAEDLKKAQVYLEWLIMHEGHEQNCGSDDTHRYGEPCTLQDRLDDLQQDLYSCGLIEDEV